jgi:hypothetical protein
MDPTIIIAAISQGGNVQSYASTWQGLTLGGVSDRLGLQSFTLTNSPLGRFFDIGGQSFSLRPDLVSRLTYGQSYSIFSGGQICGWVGNNPVTGQLLYGGNLTPSLGSGLSSSLLSSGGFP